MDEIVQFPAQQKPFRQKGIKWRKACVDWADSKTYFNYSPVRKSIRTMKINQDLVNGILHMSDVIATVNPASIKASYIPDQIQHYPIINSKLHVLDGEESKRVFDWKVVVTNPLAISEIEENKKKETLSRLQELIQNRSMSEEEFQEEFDKMDYFFTYEWQDMREIRANALLTHYWKEQNFPIIFHSGFKDAETFGEEIYQVDIVGGEPTLEKINPMKIRIFKSGYSNRIEDADIIILEDYWSPGKIIDRYYDVLSPADMKYIEDLPNKIEQGSVDNFGNYDETAGFVPKVIVDETLGEDFVASLFSEDGITSDLMPYDTIGNIRVIRVYWKSRRKIKKVKKYDPQTGETIYTFYPEDYVLDKAAGEEEQTFWINEAWEGTKIGDSIYVNMRPRIMQFNRLSNPSRCHFGIIGTIYNMNDEKPFSLVDIMKPYSYYYDAIHDRLNKLLARNWGTLVELDLAKVPKTKGWDIDKWMYYAQVNGIYVTDSFAEGNKGAATGKLAGALNNASRGAINAELGNSIQNYINLLEFIKGEMGEVCGITRQREGQIANRETVGGVERATLQSSHSTEWLFIPHEDLKKRVMEAFLEVAKIALRGRTKKFQYILSDGQQSVMEIDGDEFAECDYGLVVDNGSELQQLSQKMDMLTQAALQNQYSLSVIAKLFTSTSIMEKIRMIEREENKRQQQIEQQQQQQLQVKQQEIQQRAATEQAKMEQDYKMNQENNETKILVAEINSKAEADRLALMNADKEEDGIVPMSEADRERLKADMAKFDKKLALDKERLDFERSKAKKDQELKARQISKQSKGGNK